MMNRKEFYEYVKDNVKEYLPESYKDAEIKLQEVEKNNGLKLTGIHLFDFHVKKAKRIIALR